MGIDKYAYHSKIAHVKAGLKLACSMSLLAVCLTFGSDSISIATIVLMSLATLLLGGFGLKPYLKLLRIPAAFLVAGVVTIVVNKLDGTAGVLISVRMLGGVYGISAASLHTGLTLFLKSSGAICCLYFLSLNTPMNSFLSWMRKWCPGLLVELMELIYRFVFIIWEEAGKIHVAQASRLGYNGFVNSMKSLGELVTTVFIRAFRRADRITASLESRGFDGNFDVLIEEEGNNVVLTAGTVLACTALIAAGIFERVAA
jgi:cobalt/nickel transport system permease protein